MNPAFYRNPVATKELLAGPTATQVEQSMQQEQARQALRAQEQMPQAGAAMAREMDARQAAAATLKENYKNGLNALVARETGKLPLGNELAALNNMTAEELAAAIGMGA